MPLPTKGTYISLIAVLTEVTSVLDVVVGLGLVLERMFRLPRAVFPREVLPRRYAVRPRTLAMV